MSNKSNSFIPQIKSDLATLAASDPGLKLSPHFSLTNVKTLELFDKSLVVDFMIDKILIELQNDSEIHYGSILLFPPTGKQDISPSPNSAPFKSSSLISPENEQEQ